MSNRFARLAALGKKGRKPASKPAAPVKEEAPKVDGPAGKKGEWEDSETRKISPEDTLGTEGLKKALEKTAEEDVDEEEPTAVRKRPESERPAATSMEEAMNLDLGLDESDAEEGAAEKAEEPEGADFPLPRDRPKDRPAADKKAEEKQDAQPVPEEDETEDEETCINLKTEEMLAGDSATLAKENLELKGRVGKLEQAQATLMEAYEKLVKAQEEIMKMIDTLMDDALGALANAFGSGADSSVFAGYELSRAARVLVQTDIESGNPKDVDYYNTEEGIGLDILELVLVNLSKTLVDDNHKATATRLLLEVREQIEKKAAEEEDE